MKKELQSMLGSKYTITGSDRKMEVTDNTVKGYGNERNVALIETRNGKTFVNIFRGHWYKPGEVEEVSSIEEVVKLIRGKHG